MRVEQIRPAQREDCRTIAKLYRIASDGVADYIWSKLAAADQDILDIGQQRYEREDSVFSYRNASMVELDGDLLGMLVAFPMVVDPDYVETDPVLVPYSELEEADSYYICAMAVFEEYRGRGIGGRLLQHAEQAARGHESAKASLIVFERNSAAKRLYEKNGYIEKARREVVPHPLIHHGGDAVLMVKEL